MQDCWRSEFSELGSKWLNIVRAHAYILPAKCVDSIPSRLGVGGKRTNAALRARVPPLTGMLVLRATIGGAGRFSEFGSKWLNIVRTHACILPAKHGDAILSRLGVLGLRTQARNAC